MAALTNKQEAYLWFIVTTKKLEMDSYNQARAWQRASVPLGAGADIRAWQKWIRKTVRTALSGAKYSPVGYLKALLAQGPGANLTMTDEKKILGQCEVGEEWLAQQRANSLKPYVPKPPIAIIYAIGRRIGSKKAWLLVEEEWKKQGSPLPEDFNPAVFREYL